MMERGSFEGAQGALLDVEMELILMLLQVTHPQLVLLLVLA